VFHNLLRRHYFFTQGDVYFWICARRLRWQRATEYVVAFADNEPVKVTREQFVNLDDRLRAEAVQTIDEALELLKPDEDEEDL
jgi:hypothetical protein